jgi:hypothetical protein
VTDEQRSDAQQIGNPATGGLTRHALNLRDLSAQQSFFHDRDEKGMTVPSSLRIRQRTCDKDEKRRSEDPQNGYRFGLAFVRKK